MNCKILVLLALFKAACKLIKHFQLLLSKINRCFFASLKNQTVVTSEYRSSNEFGYKVAQDVEIKI